MPVETIAFSIGTWILGKVGDKGFDSLASKLSNTDLINKKFGKAVKKVSTEFQSTYPNLLGGNIEFFFKKEEVFGELFKLLFKISKIDDTTIENIFDTTTLPEYFIKNFIEALKNELLKDKVFDELFSNNELYIVFQGLGINIRNIAQNSDITVEKLSGISKILEDRMGNSFDFGEFIKTYTHNALNNLSQVNFIGLGIDISIKKQRKNLSDIFVKPLFRVYKDGETFSDISHLSYSKSNGIGYDDLFVTGKRLVILGNPGSGKSIVIKSIICDILKKENERFFGKLIGFLPFRIELRNYLAFKKENKGSFLKYLVFLLENEYQINNITESILINILKENKCILLFDGLDEIFDIQDKIATKNDIENFQNTFDNIYSVTTSRVIGYDEASLNETFAPLLIDQFDHVKIEEYVIKWYEKEEEIEDIRLKEIEGFISKMYEIDFELISNPLLLSLIVILYRNILKLPESKLEIYQSCTKTLVDKWDASKDLVINLDSQLLKEKDKLFADLAHWQYNELSSKSTNITYSKAKQTISKSIIRLNISKEDDCDNLADTFMEYAQKRSLYFDNNFTHKTFLEYYTAYWIYSNIEKKHLVNERNNIISIYIGNPFWFIVLELLLNLIDKDQADNDIIDEIINKQLEVSNNSIPFLINISYKLKNVSNSAIQKCVNQGIKYIDEFNKDKHRKLARTRNNSIFNSITSATRHSSKVKNFVTQELKRLEALKIDKPSQLKNIYILRLELLNPLFTEESSEYMLDDTSTFEKICRTDAYLFTLSKTFSIPYPKRVFDTIDEFISLFGIEKIFINLPSVYDTYRFSSYFETFISETIKRDLYNLEDALSVLKKWGMTYKEIAFRISKIDIGFSLDIENLDKQFAEFSRHPDLEISEILIQVIRQGRNIDITKFNTSKLSVDKLNLYERVMASELDFDEED
ncbi:NACHT domain-containing NTPase [Pedobacter sp. R20-19]|uniref:NACHT domain-containing protein n=1 Tax=Pedobacter sp. R20-19 TaxID=1270196 RepID=UPI0004931AD0|nr:hypothetical protein [Pedobacter sp. R20-19]